MTQKEANILIEIVTKVVRKELGLFKKQLLNEEFTSTPKQTQTRIAGKQDNLVDMQKGFRNQYHVQRPQTKRISNDSVLNSILTETIAIDEAERQYEEQMMANGVNLPTTETGQVMSSNKNVNHVLEAMNRDYSGMFAPKQDTQKPVANKPTQPIDRSQIRSKFMALMEDDGAGYAPSNGMDEEDFSFLDGVG